MKQKENNIENYKNKNFTFIGKTLDKEYNYLFPNAKLLYSLLVHLHHETPASDDGIRYLDLDLQDIREIFNCSMGLAYRMKSTLINAGLIGEVQQPWSLNGLGRNKIVALYVKKIIE